MAPSRYSKGSAAQPASAKTTASAQFPCSPPKRRAVQPASNHGSSSAAPASKRARTKYSSEARTTSEPSGSAVVAYITCDRDQQAFNRNHDYRAVLSEVTYAIDAGAEIINLAFKRTVGADVVNADTILPGLKELFNKKWTSSVGQPAYFCRHKGSVMSFVSASCGELISSEVLDPEGLVPSIRLTLDTPSGLLCCINTSLPGLATRTRARLLDVYTKAAVATKADYILIGGRLAAVARIFVEGQIANLTPAFEYFINEELLVLACAPTYAPDQGVTELNCFDLGTEGPYAILAYWERAVAAASGAGAATSSAAASSAAQPAVIMRPTTRTWSTPLWDSVVEKMEISAASHASGAAFIQYLTDCCFDGDLLYRDIRGEELETPIPLSQKMEEMFRVAEHRRKLHLNSAEPVSYTHLTLPTNREV